MEPLLPPVIHCLVDQEPTAFHADDAAGNTFSFAVNLSFEARAAKDDPTKGEEEEIAAKTQFEDFLADVRNVAFHLFSVSETDPKKLELTYVAAVKKAPGAEPPGTVDDLVGWLDEQRSLSPEIARYWSTVPTAWNPDIAVEAETANASHRLRAVQSWNAPVGHRFSLTHIVRIPRDQMKSPRFVVLPYFGKVENPQPPDFVGSHDYPPDKPDDIVKTALDYSYKPLGNFEKVVCLCRTNLIGEGITKPSDFSKFGLADDGYFKVDEKAQIVRRLLVWFEERAASLMAANAALSSRGKDPNNDPAFEELFGIKGPFVKEKDGKSIEVFYWGSIVWYVAARLISTLDNLVIAFLKPTATANGKDDINRDSEGEMLAPLVSLLRSRLETVVEASKLDPSALDSRIIAGAIRSAIAIASPLIATPPAPPKLQKTPAEVASALRQVYDIAPLKAGEPPSNALEFISVILDRYGAGGDIELPALFNSYARSLDGKSALTVARALLDLEQPLLGEAGAEAAIVKLVETTRPGGGGTIGSSIAKAYLEEIKQAGNPALQAAVEAAVEEAWIVYHKLLDGDFNGAEAARRASGSSFVGALLDYAKLDGKTDTPKILTDAVAESAFYSRRLVGADLSRSTFDPLIAPLMLPEPETLLLTPERKAQQETLPPSEFQVWYIGVVGKTRAHLDAAFNDAVAPIRSLIDPDARFIPDSTPQPLAIQIAANIDGSKGDEFEKHFNGIAVAIQREDKGKDPDLWTHAHLADLRWDKPKPNSLFEEDDPPPLQGAKAALHPMLPAVSDGRRPMFIEYQGFPFADRALEVRVVDGEYGMRDTRTPFYRQDTHEEKKTPPDFAPVPRLAYGRTFKTFSFITSNAGTVPFALQLKNDTVPWMPNSTVVAPTSKLVLGSAEYQRRTAIAQMAVIEQATADRPARIGALIDGVMPLAADYPRIGLEADAMAPGTRDIFREANGSGVMIATQDTKWQIGGVVFSGAPSSLIVRFFDRSAKEPDDKGTMELKFDQDNAPGFSKATAITIGVQFKPAAGVIECLLSVTCGTKTLEEKLTGDRSSLNGWLRLVLTSDASAGLTLAAPTSHKADNVAAPLLLLAPGGAPWKENLATQITATLSTPRVSYLDFERWFANADLYRRTFKADPEPDGPAAAFMSALLAAYLMRHFDAELARMIDQLPDPAVEEIRFELTALDDLSGSKLGAAGALPHTLIGKLKTFAAGIKEPEKGWTPARLLALLLKPLDELFKFKIRPMAGSKFALTDTPDDKSKLRVFGASVPPGVVARLSLDALVPADLFVDGGHPAVFHHGLKQYALREVAGKYLAFPAAALRVETMYDGMDQVGLAAIDLAAKMIDVQGIARTRRFDLMTAGEAGNAADERLWRLLGEIDATTQCWRPTGRPIYNHVNPRAFRHRETDPHAEITHPALRLELRDENLAQFEREAFFDRPDVDAHTVTQCLDPLPARTKLREHHWESLSATYFRHRFTLRSRYAGALKARRQVPAWQTRVEPGKEAERSPYGWTMRVAMLADLSSALLTRPQLRALIPLTTTPGGDEAAHPTPPVAAILQEPPFARGGLADRIASEIKTGFGYGFLDDTKHVEILDSRKEGGPNHHLDYRALEKDTALGLILRGEGPMGLTFDNVNAPAPAFPNCMISLKPDALLGNKPLPEEFFAGVAMRRYIDPDWTASAREPADELEGERCWWIEVQKLSQDPTIVFRPRKLLSYLVGDVTRDLLLFHRRDKQIEIRASKLAIDGVGGTDDDGVTILKVDEKHFADLAILHQVVAPGRYSASLFVITNAAKTERGEVNAPSMLASFEWSPPEARDKPNDPDRKPPAVTLLAPAAHAYATMASAPTFLRWTKTSRDFDFVHVPVLQGESAKDESWVLDRRHVREFVAALDPKHRELTFARAGAKETTWLCASTFDNAQPLHVHRHLGIVTSYFLKELGRPIELFDRTAAFRENRAVLDPAPSGKDAYQPREHTARVVEFETPAQILCGGAIPVPKYRTAYFDLLSTGFMKSAVKGGDAPAARAQLYFRFVGPPRRLRELTGLTILLQNAAPKPQNGGSPAPGDVLKLEFELKELPKDTFAVGAQLSLHQDARVANNPDKPATAEIMLLRSDGKLQLVKLKPGGGSLVLRPPTNDNPGLFVTIDAKMSAGGEFWTDASLLHSANTDRGAALDFDWLFTPGSEAEPAVNVSAPGLTAMVEAQARIVAVSPPIPIVKH